MRWSKTFIPTLRDNPADAEFPSHQLLIRGGFIRQLAAGIYSYLPLGQRTLLRIIAIIREEFSEVGAQEFHLPVLHPADLCLGMTHWRIFSEIARKEIRSYKDLPQVWYQIQAKYRDEARPKSGLLGLREFHMMESCSFDADLEGLDRSYQIHHDVYGRIFTRCGLRFVAADASSGTAGGSRSLEFMVRAEAGEDFVVSCDCGYAANLESATSSLPRIDDRPSTDAPREVHTPNQKTIAEITEFLKVPPTHQIKSLIYMVNDQPHLFLVRGDHQLNESKMRAAVKNPQARPAYPEEIREAFGAEAGSLGPVGVDQMPIYADLELQGRRNLTCGANKNDYHLQGVTPDVHFKPIWTELRTVEQGDGCVLCGKPLKIYRAIQLGHIIKLGAEYSENAGVLVLAADGKQTPVVMGRYGIALEQIMCSAVELHHDGDGIVWPPSIAPFSVILTPVIYRDEPKVAADRLYAELVAAGIEVLLDDRLERPGVKFKDADLIGIPYRVVIGSEKLKQGKVELFERATKKTEVLDLASLLPTLADKLAGQ